MRGWDDDSKEITVYKIEVPKGPQSLKVHFTAPSGTNYCFGRTSASQLRAGTHTRLKVFEWDKGVSAWVEDVYTHEVVGGERP